MFLKFYQSGLGLLGAELGLLGLAELLHEKLDVLGLSPNTGFLSPYDGLSPYGLAVPAGFLSPKVGLSHRGFLSLTGFLSP